MECTYGVSYDENWVLELLGAKWGKSFNRTDWPSIFNVAGGSLSERIRKCFLLRVPESPDGSNLIHNRSVKRTDANDGDLHVGVTSRVLLTIRSNTSVIVTLSSLKLSAPEMAGSA